MADRIGIMHRGRLAAVGTREQLRRQAGSSGALEEVFLALTDGWRENGTESASLT